MSGPIRKVGGGGGGGGGAVHFRSEIRKVGGGGGGQSTSGPIRKVGGQFASGPIRMCVGEGRYLCLATLSLITINGYNFDQGGAQALHTRSRMSLIVVF